MIQSFQSLLIAAVQAAPLDEPNALWNLPRILIISGACLLVLLISSRTIAKPHVGPEMPLGPLAPLFNNISVAGFIGAMSFGHILGVLASLGMFNLFK